MTHSIKHLRDNARTLRSNQTDAEKKLWAALGNRQLANLKFRRQTPIGRYIVDFLCADLNIIIELDGGQHADNTSDTERDAWLTSQGYHVLRYWNNDALSNTDGVLLDILTKLNQPPHPNPLPEGRGNASATEGTR